MLFRKGTKLYSIFTMTCPRCHEEKMFENPKNYNFKKITDMHKNCPNCGLDFEPEPGYYYGAMFLSYIWTGWFSIFLVLGTMFLLDMSLYASFAVLVAFMVINYVWILRVSRAMYINFHVKYDPKYRKEE